MSSIEVVTIGKHQIAYQRIGDDPERETVIMVNGALATATSFRQMARALRDEFNVFLYDLPYSGMSRPYNPGTGLLTKDDEAHILGSLIRYSGASLVCSMSWGGVATLLALSEQPHGLRGAIVGSFSPRMNGPMRDYVQQASRLLDAHQHGLAADLLNNTVGRYLPRLLKLANHHHLTGLSDSEVAQVHFHVRQLLAMDVESYLGRLHGIDVPVLFMNGELDEYTSASDVQALEEYIPDCRFCVIPNAGHFLELESRAVSEHVRREALAFLRNPHGKTSTERFSGIQRSQRAGAGFATLVAE